MTPVVIFILRVGDRTCPHAPSVRRIAISLDQLWQDWLVGLRIETTNVSAFNLKTLGRCLRRLPTYWNRDPNAYLSTGMRPRKY
jgi:hypothetical protein